MNRKTLIKDIISKLDLSTMSEKEKAMWIILLPNMEEKHLKKLKTSLDKETDSLTSLYMETIKNDINV